MAKNFLTVGSDNCHKLKLCSDWTLYKRVWLWNWNEY